ncbi:MAG: hypothetical protein WDM79_13555 [Terricaulis sp.]
MSTCAERIIALSETLRHWDDALATDLNAAHLFTHDVLMRALRADPELSRIAADAEGLRQIAAPVAAQFGLTEAKAA